MTRKRVTASEKKQRHEWAVRQIDAGMGLSELTAFTAETWGCSRRNARDVSPVALGQQVAQMGDKTGSKKALRRGR